MMLDGKGLIDIFMERLNTLENEFESIDMENPTDDTLQKMADNLGERHGIQWCINVIIDAMHASVKIEAPKVEEKKESKAPDPKEIAKMLNHADTLINRIEVLQSKDELTVDEMLELFNSINLVESIHKDAKEQIDEL